MDFDAIRKETEQAFAEAGVEDPDLSYLTEEAIEESDAQLRRVEDVARETEEVDAAAAAANYLYDAWFLPGFKVRGRLANSSTYQCPTSPYYIELIWSNRAIHGSCRNRSSYIWKVS